MTNNRVVYNCLALVLLGVVVGLFLKYYRELTFDFEVSVFDLFALFVTVVLAWWVAEKLEKDSDKERCEKDIIIEKLKAMDTLLEKLNDKIGENDVVPLSSIVSLIGSIDAHSVRISEHIKAHYSSIIGSNGNNFFLELDLLDNLCTNDEDGEITSSIVNNNTVYSFTDERKSDISSCSNRLSDIIFNWELLVNSA